MNLQELQNKTILLFGKSRAFSKEEFDSQMKYHGIGITKEYDESVAFVVDGRMMTPYEQNKSAELYESKELSFVKMEELESALAKAIDEDTLLMSLKLSHDRERLKVFLLNSMLSDRLFFRLLKMYSWGSEDFFENDDNRDVSAAFISRFYENIERNHNVQYSTTGFIHLIAQTKNSELLEEISTLKPLQLHPKIEIAIAMSDYCDTKLQERLFKKGTVTLLEGLSLNKNLKREFVEEFLKEKELSSNVARSLKLNSELFELLKPNLTDLALNESLTLPMQEELLASRQKEVYNTLSYNNSLDVSIIQSLLALDDREVQEALYSNSSTPVEILEEAYKNEKNHEALAQNESTPIDILYQLQLNSRYERFVKTNAGYGKHIQTQNIGWL